MRGFPLRIFRPSAVITRNRVVSKIHEGREGRASRIRLRVERVRPEGAQRQPHCLHCRLPCQHCIWESLVILKIFQAKNVVLDQNLHF